MDLTLGQSPLLREEGDEQNVRKAEHHAGDDLADKHRADGDGRETREHDRGDGRRDNGTLQSGGRRNSGSEVLVIALGVHHGHLDGAECSDAGDARAGDAAEHHVGEDRHIGDAAAQTADEETAEVNDLVHQTGLAHQLAGEHEQRDAEVDEAVHTGEETVGIHHEVAEHLGLDEK